MTIYLDNAATSFPKPPSVAGAVQYALTEVGANPGRAAHRKAREASAIVSGAREKAARLLGISDPNHVIFTKNATESINVVLKGRLRTGDRVLISSMEHNAVIRPLRALGDLLGVQVEILPCDATGQLDLDDLRRSLADPPRLVVLNHASNVNGALQPAVEAARLCAERDVPLLLDAAQTAGVVPISAAEWGLGMLACSGHKALYGPSGVGVLYIRPDLDVRPLLEGGTGSRSEEDRQPSFRPDCFESGTLNLPGIAGLAAGIDFIMETGQNAIRSHELELACILEENLADLPGLTLYRPGARGTGVVSFTIEGLNPGDVGYLLDEGYDIAVRTGLHCAPLAHRTLGSFPEGSVRVSPGYFTTREEIDQTCQALRQISQRHHRKRKG
jgi:cysteine desulfurase family protein